jgi:hypothetical protein
MPSWRLTIVCEDRLTERFLRRLCERYGAQVLDVVVAPFGKGAASNWVKQQYPTYVKRRRAKGYQQQLGLLVCIDGDDKGTATRQRELAQQLESAGLPARTPDEPVAILVPTWSIETWLAYLCGKPALHEAESVKDHPSFGPCRDLWKDGPQEAATCKRAATEWRAADAALPSLDLAYREAARVGL